MSERLVISSFNSIDAALRARSIHLIFFGIQGLSPIA